MCILWVFENYLDYFVQGQFYLPTTLSFQGIKLKVLLGFENFQIVAHGFLGCQLLGKCRIFHFGQVLMHHRTFQGILEWLHMLLLHLQAYFQNIYSFIWLQALSNKLHRFKYQKMWIFCNFCISSIFSTLEKQ